MQVVFCDCDGFVLRYVNQDDVPICRCGHPPDEHLDKTGLCIGEVLVA